MSNNESIFVTDPDCIFFRPVAEWPQKIWVDAPNLKLEVSKGYCDRFRQEIVVSLRSKAYWRFLYDNQGLLLGDNCLPKVRVKRSASDVALVLTTLSMAPDPNLTSQAGEGHFAFATEPYLPGEELYTIGSTYLGELRLQTFMSVIVKSIATPELALNAFLPGGVVEKNLCIFESGLSIIYLALRAGHKPIEVLELIDRFSLMKLNESVEALVLQAHAQMSH